MHYLTRLLAGALMAAWHGTLAWEKARLMIGGRR